MAPTATTERVQVRLEREKETTHTVRFKEVVEDVDGEPRIGTLYVPKSTLRELGSPNEIVLTVEAYA